MDQKTLMSIINGNGSLIKEPVTEEGKEKVMIVVFTLHGNAIDFGDYSKLPPVDEDGYIFSLRRDKNPMIQANSILVDKWIDKPNKPYLNYLKFQYGDDITRRDLGLFILYTFKFALNRSKHKIRIIQNNEWTDDTQIVTLYKNFIDGYWDAEPLPLPVDEYLGNAELFFGHANPDIVNTITVLIPEYMDLNTDDITGIILSFDCDVHFVKDSPVSVRGLEAPYPGLMFNGLGTIKNLHELVNGDSHRVQIKINYVDFDSVYSVWNIPVPGYLDDKNIATTIVKAAIRLKSDIDNFGIEITS